MMEKDRALNLLQNGLLPQVHGAYHDALEMAIEALQTEPCEDAVSRKQAIDELVRWGKIPEYNEAEKNIMGCCIGMLSSLPSVNPQKVIRCKDCRHRDPEDKKCDCGCWHIPFTTEDDDYCSYAEAKMEEGD